MRQSIAKKECGQALVEFALILPVLLLLLFGIVEFGRVYNAGLTVNQAARVGARTAGLGAGDMEITAAVQQAAPVLDPAKLAVSVEPEASLRSRGQEVTVKVSYPVTVVVPFISAITGETVEVSGVCVMRME